MTTGLFFTYGLIALLLSINGLRRVDHPKSRLPPLWPPAMITTELAPFWLLVTGAVGFAGYQSGFGESPIGQLGISLLVASGAVLASIIARTVRSARSLSPLIETPLPKAGVPAFVTGRPVKTPQHLQQTDGVSYDGEYTMDLIEDPTVLGPKPAMVYVHGGSWTGGGPHKQARQMYHALATAGWLVAAVRYPFAPKASIPDQVAAIKRSIVHLKSNAHRLGLDPARVVLAGSSAGAHLAALTALTPAPRFQPGFEDADAGVAACIPMYGIYDMANRRSTRWDWPFVETKIMKTTYPEDPEAYHEASPIDQVRSDAAPFLVIHGTHDSVVPIPEAEEFVADLRKAGGHVEYLRVHGAQHGFDAVTSPISRRVAAYVTTWLSSLWT